MGLGRINVLAGDFKKGLDSQYMRSNFHMKRGGKFFREKISGAEVEKLEIATEEAVVSIGGAAGWGWLAACFLAQLGCWLAYFLAVGVKTRHSFVYSRMVVSS